VLARRIAAAYVLLIAAVAAGLGLYLPSTLRQAQLDQLEANLIDEARMVAEAARPHFLARSGTGIQDLAWRIGQVSETRVTLMSAEGVVLGDSVVDATSLENHASRPEVASVLSGGPMGVSLRHSASLDLDLIYAAAPIYDGGRLLGVARMSRERLRIEVEFQRAIVAVLIAVAIASAVAAMGGVLVARRISRPLRRLTEAAEALSRGERATRLDLHGRDEIAILARAFDEMATRLRDTIGTLTSDRGRLSAVLAAMVDGVILIDRSAHVLLVNDAAHDLLQFDPERLTAAEAPRLIELVHDHELIDLAQRVIADQSTQNEIVRFMPSGRHLRITGTPMSDGAAALLLVQDVTAIRRAETIRREFVANVSHELKTPLASIKALTETLEGGAMDDPPAARDFLQRMHVEVDGLAQLVQELLDIARIESGRTPLSFAVGSLVAPVQAGVERLRPQADRAGVELRFEGPVEPIDARIDVARIEGAVINLVHNAIKFTPAGGTIAVAVRREPAAGSNAPVARVTVTDTGVGIAPDDCDRLFERFYKSDRSRASSGTGLGLAIVKHAVIAHGGQVGVTSQLGAGSTFWFTLPIRDGATP
jgi:two-component system phosphate regulon sensor histidine kinase PhoR